MNHRLVPNRRKFSVRMALAAVLLAAPLVPAATPLAMRVDLEAVDHDGGQTTMAVEIQLAPADRTRVGRQCRLRIRLNRDGVSHAHILQDIDFDIKGLTRVEHAWPPGTYELTLGIENLRGSTLGVWNGTVEIPGSIRDEPTVRGPRPDPVPPAPATPAETEPAPPDARSPVPIETPPAAAPPSESDAATATETPAPSVDQKEPPTVPPTIEAARPPAPKATQETPDTADAPPARPEGRPAPATPPNEPRPQVSEPPAAPPEPKTQEPAPEVESSGPGYDLLVLIDTSDQAMAQRAFEFQTATAASIPAVRATTLNLDASDPAAAIIQAAARLAGRRTTRSLVVLTDGRWTASRSQWKDLRRRLEQGGRPMVVIGLWNDDYRPATRKRLGEAAERSGGGSYLMQPAERPSRAVAVIKASLEPAS